MKCIDQALRETEFRPRAKWWGFVRDGRRYLMRYHHTIAIFSRTEVLYTWAETKTDKAGLTYALTVFKPLAKK